MAGDTVARIKEKLSIIDVVQPYVKLTRTGKYWKGLSPFNKEKTPSFFVNTDRGSYYCFSSNQGGDMFTFVEKMEGVDFKGALKILAEKAGVPLTYSSVGKASREKLDRAREALARAQVWFASNLTESSSAYAYARSRGLTPETITAWELGFASDSWRELLEVLVNAGFSVPELSSAGLIKEADGKPGTHYDRFRNRLMFPIRDSAGRVVAFTGRSLDPNDQAKYLNSPETSLFKKSHVLFAMEKAKDAIRTRGFALLMEGQMDVIHAHQASWTNAVALSGTALSPEHVALLKRYTENLMLCLDADRAGLAATHKHAIIALASGMKVKAVMLPREKDPADLLSTDAKEFAKRVAAARSVVEFFLSVAFESERDPHRLVLAVERTVLPLLASVASPMEREHFIGIIAHAISSTPEAVRASVPSRDKNAPVFPSKPVAVPADRVTDKERLVGITQNYPDTALAERVKSEYARIVGAAMPSEDSSERVLFESGILYGEAPNEHAADDILNRFERTTLEKAYALAVRALRQAELSNDTDTIRTSEQECAKVAKALAELR